jgi:S1-C subfamily serine protease
MHPCFRWAPTLVGAFLLVGTVLLVGPSPAADGELSRVQLGKLGKASTALVEVQVGFAKGHGSAFCVHPAGMFVTNEHVVRAAGPSGTVLLVLNPAQKTQKPVKARVVRLDRAQDLALLVAEGVKDLPTLPLGSDADLSELMEVVAFGFPFGTMLSEDRREYPAVSVNVGSITALRKKGDKLHRIQVDVALNPGNSGGPVLDRKGKVVGVVVAGVRGSGVNFVIPVSHLTAFLDRPELTVTPPNIDRANMHKEALFEARALSALPGGKALAPGTGPAR